MKNKFFGVVEGFYRKPYSFHDRLSLIEFLSKIGLDTYVYGPKQDVYHREKWFAEYPKSRMREFRELNMHCSRHKIRFNYALSPMSRPIIKKIIYKIQSMIETGISNFSLFYDDITVTLNKTTAFDQADTANELLNFLEKKISKPVLFFCPTQYHGFDDSEYIRTISRRLNKRIMVFWTGPKIVSKRIYSSHLKKIIDITKRKPLIWDNLFANDYLPNTIFNFPYRYRTPEIIQKTFGILINPMNEYRASKPLIYTTAEFIKNPYEYIPRKAWQRAHDFLNSSMKD